MNGRLRVCAVSSLRVYTALYVGSTGFYYWSKNVCSDYDSCAVLSP
jgi:hypothetical protein